MSFKDRPLNKKFGIIGAAILPAIYVLTLLITKEPDFIVFVLGPLGFIFWIVQWVAFLIGGWILAIIATILLLVLIGYALGRFTGWLVAKFKK